MVMLNYAHMILRLLFKVRTKMKAPTIFKDGCWSHLQTEIKMETVVTNLDRSKTNRLN